MNVRTYQRADWPAIERIHDSARKMELSHAGLHEAFLPLCIAAAREQLFDYPGLFVAEENGEVLGFAACTEEELAWLYVAPKHMRKGVGSSLWRHMISVFPQICVLEVLKGNEPARAFYERLGFRVSGQETGQMPGNEAYTVEVYVMRRTLNE